MPARKSNVSTVSNDEEDGLNIEDLNLPKSIVQRLGKGVLPANTQIQKDALLAMSKSATVFVNYLTSCAAEHAARTGKKTVVPKDVFEAMDELEFNFMLPRLEAEVQKFTSIQADKRNTYRKKVREDKKAAKDKEVTNGGVAGTGEAAHDEESPPAKRARLEGGVGEEEDDGGDETVEMGDGEQEIEDEDVDDDEVEEDDEGLEEGLTEDPLEEREDVDDEDMEDAEESD